MSLKNSTYDKLKWLVTICLPRLITLWLAIATIWHVPYGEPIGATIGAITAFLGGIMGISSKNYKAVKESIDNGTEHD